MLKVQSSKHPAFLHTTRIHRDSKDCLSLSALTLQLEMQALPYPPTISPSEASGSLR